METSDALESFTALSQDTRLATFQLLIRHEPYGLAAGEIARQLDVPHNTLSSHLNVLARAGLIHAKRDGRSIIYRANLEHLQRLIQFLAVDCCAGHPEHCFPNECHPHSEQAE